MKRLFILTLLVFALVAPVAAAQAQNRAQNKAEQEEFMPQTRTPVTSERANSYYAECMAVDDERMSETAQAELCACTSVKMMSRLTMEELDLIGQPTKSGKAMMHKMQAEVYGPCMQTAVQELLYDECMRDRKIQAFNLRDQPGLCTCMSKRSAAYLETHGEAMMRNILVHNPDTTDPLPAIMGSPSFRQQASNHLFSCLRESGTPQ